MKGLLKVVPIFKIQIKLNFNYMLCRYLAAPIWKIHKDFPTLDVMQLYYKRNQLRIYVLKAF